MKRNKPASQSLTSLMSKVSNSSGTTRQKFSDTARMTGAIRFGRPSSLGVPKVQASAGSIFQKLSGEAASGGLANMLASNSGPSYFHGIGLSSLISGIASLLGGSKKKQAPLTLFQLPSSISQTVEMRNPNAPAAAASANPTVHVNVQALSSSSILDHSNEIAKAVKSAILNSHALNDVIAEL